jgi:hypothetical protein
MKTHPKKINETPMPTTIPITMPADTITVLPPDLAETISGFSTEFRSACASYLKAAQIYAAAIATHGDHARVAFADQLPDITTSLWRRLESVGNGTMDPRLLSASSRGAQSLRRLPAPQQTEYLNSGVDVLLPGGDSLRVAIDHLQPSQVQQVFAGSHVRTLGEQRIPGCRCRCHAGDAINGQAVRLGPWE